MFFSFFQTCFIADTKYKMQLKREKARRNKDQVYVNGYRFVIASQSDTTIYFKCANFRNKCNARASKRKETGDTFITKSQHAPSCVLYNVHPISESFG